MLKMRGAWFPPALLLAITAAYVLLAGHGDRGVSGPALAEQIPLQLDAWVGEDRSITPEERDELLPDDMVYRAYRRADGRGRPVGVLVLFWGASAAKPHAPEICLQSQDYSVFNERQIKLEVAGLPPAAVNTFHARKGISERVIYYWWYTGDGATGDFGAFKKDTAVRGVLGQPSWGAFVRVETVGLREEAPALHDACRTLSQDLLRVLPGIFDIS